MRNVAIAIVLGGLLAAAPAFAQQHQHGQQPAEPGGMMQMQGMHGMMMPGPMMILRLREPLGLTEAQAQRLEALREREQQAHHPHMMAAMQAMQEANRMLEQPDADLARYEAKLREAADHMVQAHLAMARTGQEAREILTPEQRSKLQTGMEMMRHMMPGAGPGRPGDLGPGRPPAPRR